VAGGGQGSSVLLEIGRRAWALVGVLLVGVAAFLALSRVSPLVVGLLLALFPAALLAPAAGWLRARAVPRTLAALLPIVGLITALALTVRFVVPSVAEEAPALLDAAQRGVDRVREFLSSAGLPSGIDSLEEVVNGGLGSGGTDLAGRGLSLASSVVSFGTGLTVLVIALFFYLRDGRRLWSALTDLSPARHRQAVQAIGERVWWTLGSYFRGQLIIALFDAVFIGLGLLLLDVPLALPLAVVVFLGGLFPIVGALVSGLLAVLVAFADAGLATAALTLGLVVLVQQLESNLLEPWILSKAIALHPLVVLSAITAGALSLGVLGAFLSVPLAASVARALDYLRGRTPDAGPGSAPA
jgi:predicted PurR-regulated permease PerM